MNGVRRYIKVKLVLILLSISVTTSITIGVAFSQERLADLKPAHAAALGDFLSRNTKYKFLPESSIDADYLKAMRQGGKRRMPYYTDGDFNRDGIVDFAVIVSQTGKIRDNGAGMAETHRYDHPLAVVVFNGSRGGRFLPASIEPIEAPLVSYVRTELKGRRAALYFGVFETDDVRMFTPTKNGYIVNYPNTP